MVRCSWPEARSPPLLAPRQLASSHCSAMLRDSHVRHHSQSSAGFLRAAAHREPIGHGADLCRDDAWATASRFAARSPCAWPLMGWRSSSPRCSSARYILQFFGISLAAVQMGGGLLVTVSGWKILNKKNDFDDKQIENAPSSQEIFSQAFYPLTMPLTVGPGSIAVALTLGSNLHAETHLQLIVSALTAIIGILADRGHHLPLLLVFGGTAAVSRTYRHQHPDSSVRFYRGLHRSADCLQRAGRLLSCAEGCDRLMQARARCASPIECRVMRLASRLLLLVSLALVLTACSHQPPAKKYELDGRVVAVDPAARQLTIAHQAVPGLMEGMTMPFIVGKDDAWVFRAIAPGDQVHATLVITDHAELQDINFSKGSDGAGDGTSQMHLPQPGEAVPDFKLTNQNGAAIHFQQFMGRPLLITFIYTRCPFPDYCLRMSHNFARVLQELQKNPEAFAQAQLLSISIDPEHDKPADLQRYGASYVGQHRPEIPALAICLGLSRAGAQSRGLLRPRLQQQRRANRAQPQHRADRPGWKGA